MSWRNSVKVREAVLIENHVLRFDSTVLVARMPEGVNPFLRAAWQPSTPTWLIDTNPVRLAEIAVTNGLPTDVPPPTPLSLQR